MASKYKIKLYDGNIEKAIHNDPLSPVGFMNMLTYLTKYELFGASDKPNGFGNWDNNPEEGERESLARTRYSQTDILNLNDGTSISYEFNGTRLTSYSPWRHSGHVELSVFGRSKPSVERVVQILVGSMASRGFNRP
jgi:hypothetical protein